MTFKFDKLGYVVNEQFPTGLIDPVQVELWTVCEKTISNIDVGDDVKVLALHIREQIRLKAKVEWLTELVYRLKDENEKLRKGNQ